VELGRYNLRFRRQIRFGRHFRLNFGKRGMSVSAGGPGMWRTWHTSGRRTTTIGLPGTGISWQKIDSATDTNSTPRTRQSRREPQQPSDRPSDLDLVLNVQEELQNRPDND